MKKINKTGLVTAVAIAATALAPQMAAAANVKKAKSAPVSSSGTSAQSALERRLELMEQEMAALRGELAKTRAETKAETRATAEKVAAHSSEVDEKLQAHKDEKKNLIFFRGGYADMVNSRSNQVFSDLYAKDNGGALGPANSARDGTYFGAGLDYSISDDLFGLMDETEFMGEVMFDWKRWDSQTGVNGSAAVVPVAATVLNNPATGGNLNVNPGGRHLHGVTLSQFTLSASPKIKFLKGSAFRPWIIPVGMTFNVISPPSDAGTVLAPGAMFGAGVDYNIWKNLFVGLDGRYNLVSQELDGVKASHYMIGGYLGFGF